MAIVATKPMTADEFWDWIHRPGNEGRSWELVNGEIEEMPPPGETHGVLCGWITAFLWQYVIRRGRGRVASNDTGLIVSTSPDTVRGVDVMMFDESRPLEQIGAKFATEVPKLVVEVLSPSDKMTKVNRRIAQYLERGVPLVWLVDPETRSVTTYRIGRAHTTLDETDELTGEDALPDFRCQVAELFALPGAPKS